MRSLSSLPFLVNGVDPARWPKSNPPGGVAQEGLLIPVISSKFGVDGGDDEQKVRHVEELSVKHAVRVDDFLRRASVQHFPIMS